MDRGEFHDCPCHHHSYEGKTVRCLDEHYEPAPKLLQVLLVVVLLLRLGVWLHGDSNQCTTWHIPMQRTLSLRPSAEILRAIPTYNNSFSCKPHEQNSRGGVFEGFEASREGGCRCKIKSRKAILNLLL